MGKLQPQQKASAAGTAGIWGVTGLKGQGDCDQPTHTHTLQGQQAEPQHGRSTGAGPEPHRLPVPRGLEGRGRAPGQSAVKEAGGEGRVTCHRQHAEVRDRQLGAENKSHRGLAEPFCLSFHRKTPRGYHGNRCIQWCPFPHNRIL